MIITILELLAAAVISTAILLATNLVKRLCWEVISKSRKPA